MLGKGYLIVFLIYSAFEFSGGSGDPPQSYSPGVDPTPWNYFDLIDECGIQAPGIPIADITSFAGIGELPWVAKLVYVSPSSTPTNIKLVSRCGGALITTTYVLTAQHCIVPGLMGARFGDYDSGSDKFCTGELCADPPQNILMKEYIKHPSFDIAIIVLKEPANFTMYVRPICLPWNNRIIASGGGPSLVAGWESRDENGRREFTALRTHKMVQSHILYCEKRMRMSLSDEQFCATTHYDHLIEKCRGVDGGPLMKYISINGTRKYFVAGISSFGNICEGFDPIGFVNTSSILGWLFTVMEPVKVKPKTLFEHYFY